MGEATPEVVAVERKIERSLKTTSVLAQRSFQTSHLFSVN